jgi:hypothetical protein
MRLRASAVRDVTENGDVNTAVGLRVIGGLLASLVLAACYLGAVAGQVDGWSIGEPVACAPTDARCQQMIEVATKRLDDRDSGHPPVTQVSVHAEGMYPNTDGGGMGLVIRSGGPPTIIVFVLADGSRRAIGVKYVLNDDVPTTYDHGPERREGGGWDQGPVETI